MAHRAEKEVKLMAGMPNEQSKMGSDHWEKDQRDLDNTSNLRYTDAPNPEALERSTNDLANYVKRNRMKY